MKLSAITPAAALLSVRTQEQAQPSGKIGLYSGADFKGTHPAYLEHNQQVAINLVSRDVTHYMSVNLSDTPAYNIAFWEMLENVGMTMGAVPPCKNTIPTESEVAALAYVNDIPNLSHVFIGHEVYEKWNHETRRQIRQLYEQYITKPLRWYWGRVDVPARRVGWEHPAGGMWQDYMFGNECERLQGENNIIHVCPGKSGENDLPAHWNEEPNWVVEKFLEQKYFVDRYSPHGHQIAVHVNVKSDYTDIDTIGYTLARLAQFADYVYLRPDGLVTSAQLDGISVAFYLNNS